MIAHLLLLNIFASTLSSLSMGEELEIENVNEHNSGRAMISLSDALAVASAAFSHCEVNVGLNSADADLDIGASASVLADNNNLTLSSAGQDHFQNLDQEDEENCLATLMFGNVNEADVKMLYLKHRSHKVILVDPPPSNEDRNFSVPLSLHLYAMYPLGEDSFELADYRSGNQTHKCDRVAGKGVACQITKTLRIVYDTWFPMVIVGKDGSLSGVMYDMLIIIARRLGLKVELILNPNRFNWGQPVNGNQSHWSGMIGMVQRGEVDGCAAGVGINQERSRVVDFTLSVVRITFAMFARTPSADNVSWENYLKEFDLPTWLCIVATSVISAMALSVALAAGSRSKMEAGRDASAVVIRSLLSKGTDINVKFVSTKSMLLITLLFSTVILTGYRSCMNSFLAVVKPASKIKTMDDVLQYTSGLTYWAPNYFEVLWRDSPPKSTNGKLYANFLADPRSNPRDYSVMINNVVEHNYVLAGPYQTIRIQPDFDCRLSRLDIDLQSDIHTSFIFTRDTPYAAMFSREIIHLKNQGVLDRILFRYNLRKADSDDCQESAFALGLTNVFTPFFVVVLGVGFAVAISVVEKVFRMASRRRRGLLSGRWSSNSNSSLIKGSSNSNSNGLDNYGIDMKENKAAYNSSYSNMYNNTNTSLMSIE